MRRVHMPGPWRVLGEGFFCLGWGCNARRVCGLLVLGVLGCGLGPSHCGRVAAALVLDSLQAVRRERYPDLSDVQKGELPPTVRWSPLSLLSLPFVHFCASAILTHGS